MLPAHVLMSGDGWSPSGEWFMWKSVDGAIEGNISLFFSSLWVVSADGQEVSLLFYDVTQRSWLDSKTSLQLSRGWYQASWSPTGKDFYFIPYISDEDDQRIPFFAFNQQGEIWYSDLVDTIFESQVRWLADGGLL